MKTRVIIKFKNGTKKVLNDVHIIVWDKAFDNIENDKYAVIIFDDPDKGTGTMFAERDAIEELNVSLYSDVMYS